MSEATNIFEAISKYADWDFEPSEDSNTPLTAPPGSKQRVEQLRRFVELGQPLWHEDDATLDGVTGSDEILRQRGPKPKSQTNAETRVGKVARGRRIMQTDL